MAVGQLALIGLGRCPGGGGGGLVERNALRRSVSVLSVVGGFVGELGMMSSMQAPSSSMSFGLVGEVGLWAGRTFLATGRAVALLGAFFCHRAPLPPPCLGVVR